MLDVGCGDGELLRLLMDERDVDGRGIELSQHGVNDCVAKGLSVIQGDADADLADYPDDGFDYVILSQTLQATRHPRVVLEHMLRIGRRAIVSVPNFGHWSVRAQLALRGRMPVTQNLAHSWYDTPNIHFCTIADFVTLAHEVGRDDRQERCARPRRPAPAARLAEMGRGTSSASKPSSCCTAGDERRASGQASPPPCGGGLRRGVAPILGRLRVR